MYFQAEHCERCVHDETYQRTQDAEDGCEIILYAMALDLNDDKYPRDTWVWFGGKPTCLAFRESGGDDS